MARFKIKFAQLENGWAQVFFWVDGEAHENWFSRVVYGDAFARLCEALRALREEEKLETVVIWMAEPQEYEMRFSKADGNIKFEMWCFESHTRDIAKPSELEISASGSCDEICLPFWRALRMLESVFKESDE